MSVCVDVSDRALRVMRAYGPADWLPIVHTGWDGGVDHTGRRKDLFRKLLHECGFHFVTSGHTYYVRVPDDFGIEVLTQSLKALAGTLRRPNKADTRNNRSRVKARYPLRMGMEGTVVCGG